MMHTVPKSPFATRLSGSAKEIELRLRNIFQWKKGRPPIAVFALTVIVLAVLCGGLVGLRGADGKQTLGEVYGDFFIEGDIRSIELINSDRTPFFCSSEGAYFYLSFNDALEYIQSIEVKPKRVAKKYLELDDKGYDIIYLQHSTEESMKLKVFDQYDSKIIAIGQQGSNGSSFAPGAKVYRLSKSFDMNYIRGLFIADEEWPTPSASGVPSDVWRYENTTDPETTVQSAIVGQKEKAYTIEILIDQPPVVDEAETQRMCMQLIGSELAQSRDWSDDLLENHFVAVRAEYYAQYDHTKTALDDGTITQFFYLLQDPETNLWSIIDNSSPNAALQPEVTIWNGGTIGFSEIELSITLPKEWAGKIGYIDQNDSLTFVHLASREIEGYEQQGVLFWINQVEGFYPADYLFPQPGWCLAATENYTICLGSSSDVQYPSNIDTIAEEYKQLFHPEQIQIVYSNHFLSECVYAVNNESLTDDIYRCDDVYISKDTPTHGKGTVYIPEISTEYVIAGCHFLLCDDECDPEQVVLRVSQGYAPVYRPLQVDEFIGNYRIMRFAMEIPEPMVDSLKQQGIYERILVKLARQYFYLIELDDTHYAYLHVVKTGAEDTVEAFENEAKQVDEFIKSVKIEFSTD